jgi:general secretion pathway protein C
MDRLKQLSLREVGTFVFEIALVTVLAISLAHWSWVAVTPRAAAASALPQQPSAQPQGPVVRRHLFGAAQEVGQPVAAGGGGLTLFGVFAERSPGAGRAILARQGSKPEMVVAGEPIDDGLVLREVHPDHVIVLRDGAPERVDLERQAPGAASPVARMPIRK